jgi:anti-sigma factor RsiW
MPHLSDEDRANLVAYLDGELDAEAAQALEAKLSLDPNARAEADALKRTWELLDYLPRPEPSASFTHRTLERLAVRHPPASRAPGRLFRWPLWALGLGWAAALLLAAGGGLLAAHWLRPRPPAAALEPADVQEQMVRYLRVLENHRLYENAEDIAFVRDLDSPELFGEDEPGT